MATDIQAKLTDAKTRIRAQKETERANREGERLTKRGQNIKATTDIIGSATKLASPLIGLLKGNDPKWYTRFKSLADSMGKVAIPTPAGIPVDLNDNSIDGTDPSVTYTDIMAPGCIGKVTYFPTFGRDERFSAVNNIAQRIYTYIRHWNSGAANYDETEYMFYLYAVASLYEIHAWLARVYGILNTYNVSNVNTPYALLKAMNVDYDDWRNHIADVHYLLANLKTQIASFAVPEDLTLIHRRYWLNLNIFKDRDSERAQYFFYNPNFVYKYELYTEEDVVRSRLVPVIWPGSQFIASGVTRTFSDVSSLITDIVNALYTNTDIGIMSGDTLKAFKDSKFMILPDIPVDFKCIAHWDETASLQFHNTRLVKYVPQSAFPNYTDFIIDQADGFSDALKNTYFEVPLYAQADNAAVYDGDEMTYFINKACIIDSPYEELTSDQVLELTRNIPILKYDRNHENFSAITTPGGVIPASLILSCGTEIMNGLFLYAFKRVGDINSLKAYPIITEHYLSLYTLVNSNNNGDLLEALALYTTYDTRPRIYIMVPAAQKSSLILTNTNIPYSNQVSNDATTPDRRTLWDMDNVLLISWNQIENLHYISLMSELLVKMPGFES